jgi:amidase
MMRRLTRDHTVPVPRRYRVFEPALVAEPGETLVVETINHMTPIVRGPEDLHHHGSPRYREREETGPIAVRGAGAGDMLAVRIEAISIVGLPHAHGSGPLCDRFPPEPRAFPVEGDRLRFPGGVLVPASPMVGDIYTTPTSPSPPFFDHGGNMDFPEVKPGNTLYLPVFREGGLLVLGDVHAAQGDGEIYGEGAECAADVTVTVSIDRRYRMPRPLVETPDALISLAGRDNLFDSLRCALQDMTALLARLLGIGEADAYVTCAAAGSVRIAGSLATRGMSQHGMLVGVSVPKAVFAPGT